MQAQAPPQALMRIVSQSPLPSAGTTASAAGCGSTRRRVAPTPVQQVARPGQDPSLSCSATQLTWQDQPRKISCVHVHTGSNRPDRAWTIMKFVL